MPLPNDFDPDNISPHAPIPNPQGEIIGAPAVRNSDDWVRAPQIVQSVRILNILGATLTFILLILFLIALALANKMPVGSTSRAEWFAYVVSMAITLPIYVWLIGALKSGSRGAWTGQIVLSALGLFSCCPCGLLLHGYILSQWFKPEVKQWFSVY